MQLKKILAAAILGLGIVAPATAQTEEEFDLGYKRFPHMFVGIQGGGQTTFTNYDNTKLITPTASVSFGAWFTPVVGARLHVNGVWNKGGIKYTDLQGQAFDQKYDYKYATTDLDLMLNLVTLFGRKNYYPVNLYLIGGVGLTCAWDNGDAFALKDQMPFAWDGKKLSHNARVGLQLDWNICKNLSANIEVDANSLNDRYNSKNCQKDDWQLTAQVGLAFKFGYKKVSRPAPVEEWATRIDTIWYDETNYVPRVENGSKVWNVFYQRAKSNFSADEQLQAIGTFLKSYRDCKIDVKSYADVQTGNPKINMMYSRERTEHAVEGLVGAGVDSTLITSSYYGDTVQPFAENDLNRVSIITATGLKDVKDKKVEKKFRTEEVRYRVK